jgi:membrane protein implicated in regulation of membrane protease activity
MRRIFLRATAAALATSMTSGCILTRLTDRAFLGVSARKATYEYRVATGLFILPFAWAVDVATFPIQMLIVVIVGDDFIFGRDRAQARMIAMREELEGQPAYAQLSQGQREKAFKGLVALAQSGKLSANIALALNPDATWTLVPLDAEAHSQLIVRAQAAQQQPVALAALERCESGAAHRAE